MNSKKNIIHGIAAAPGISIGTAYLFTKEIEKVSDGKIDDIQSAKEDLQRALDKSKKELNKVFELAVNKLGERRAAIFEAQLMILDDPFLIETIFKRIEDEKRIPEIIVDEEISKYQKLMEASEEQYMRERLQDIEDIKNRIIRNLRKKKWRSKIKNDVIVVTESVTPADTVLFSKANVKGYVTNYGGLTSHAAIVARSLHIPAAVGLIDATTRIKNGDLLILDGYHGDVLINPTNDQLEEFKQKLETLNQLDKDLLHLKDEPARTVDGHEIELQANLDLQEEISTLVQSGAKGIGLVRTEQLFEGLDNFPTEEEQYIVYKKLVEKIYPGVTTIRAFDIGGDKVLPVDIKEPNPFLGWRGVRLLLDNVELFKTQIRAVLRASEHKNVRLMIPMITSISEIRQVKYLLNECKTELTSEGIKFDDEIQLGIMIEVPSAAVMAREYAEEVDFFSIGTNDLIMYLLGVDRGNEIVSELYQEFHPSVIRIIKHIINDGKKGGVDISICGEMAADIMAVPLLVGLGLDSLSISGAAIPYTKKIIRSLNFDEVKELAELCLTYRTEKEVHEELDRFFKDKLNTEIGNLY